MMIIARLLLLLFLLGINLFITVFYNKPTFISTEQCLPEVIFPCQNICLQDNVVYTCTGIGANLITWTVPNLMGGTEQLQILQHKLHDTSDPFTAQFVSYQNNNIISTLSFTATTVLHNKDIVCNSGGDNKTCNIMMTSKIQQRNMLLLYNLFV